MRPTGEPGAVCFSARHGRAASRPFCLHHEWRRSAQATENANRVLSAMHPELLACYQKRVAVSPAAHGFITVDIVIGSDGRVMKVETTGGAILGESTMSCNVRRIEKAAFEPPHGGGTRRIHVPFSLKRMAAGEDP